MPLLKIARLGHPVLRQPASPVSAKDLQTPALQQFIDDMADTMRDSDGVGLAAPQVHAPLRIILVEVRNLNPRYPDQPPIPLTPLVNPEITSRGDTTEEDWEGCLSIPDLRGRVPRYTALTINALNRHGQPVTLEAKDFFARVIQHEIDHLDGVMFLDRMKDFSTLTHLREFQKYWLPVATLK